MTILFLAGQTVTADALQALVPLSAEKTSDTSSTSDTTHDADAELVLAVEADCTYEIMACLVATSAANAAGDISYSFTYPTGAILTVVGVGPHNALASGSQADGEFNYVLNDSASPSANMPYGASIGGAGTLLVCRLTVSSTSGNFTVRSAQQASNASASTLKAGSFIHGRRLE